MKIIITEEQRKKLFIPITESEESKKGKLFIPRRLSGENSRFIQWNKEQPIVDGERINQYTHDGKKTGIWEYYYPNGQLLSKGSYENDNIEGYWERYYFNGQLQSKGSFKDGKKTGIWEDYYRNGQLEFKGLYKNGKQEGIWERYHNNGQLWAKGSFKNGKYDGIWEEYWDNGQLLSKGSYKNDNRDGIWEEYFPNGKLKSKGSFKNDKLIKELPITESEESKKGKLFIPRRLSGENSRFIQWNKEQPIVDGERINQYTHDGKKTGIWEIYYNNEQLMSKGSYEDNIKTGIWEDYYTNGQLKSKGSFKDGNRDGIWESYYTNGQLWSKCSYKNGLREGYWEYYYENGQLQSKGSFKDGKYDGIWEKYHRNGQLLSKGSYKNDKLIKELPITESEESKKGKLFIPLTESEESKKGKLFIPRRLSGENSRFIQWNKEQPIVDGVQINQYTHDGKPIGYWDNWVDDNDILVGKGLFVKGKKEGLWEEYRINSKLKLKGNYTNDKREGIWEYYDENGQLLYKGSFKNDKLIKKLPITESEESKKGKLFIPRRLSGENSRFIQWNKEQPIVDGERINQYTHNGKKDGIWEEYYDNGQLRSKGSYENDNREGYWEDYHRNGQLKSKGSFKDGKKQGIWEYYWHNGQLWSKDSFKDGNRDGIWEYYDENGKLKFKGSFKDGLRDGIWEFYYKNGKLESKGSYKNDKLIKELPLTESEESKKGKLFIPRRIDQRKIEAEELKQKYISEIKEIIEEEGIISMGELGGNSIVYGYSPEDEENEIALIEQFYSDHVEVVVYGGYKYNTEETSFPVKYEELKLDQLFGIRELLETYNSH